MTAPAVGSRDVVPEAGDPAEAEAFYQSVYPDDRPIAAGPALQRRPDPDRDRPARSGPAHADRPAEAALPDDALFAFYPEVRSTS